MYIFHRNAGYPNETITCYTSMSNLSLLVRARQLSRRSFLIVLIVLHD